MLFEWWLLLTVFGRNMQPYGDESYDSQDADFPIETVNGKLENAVDRSGSFTALASDLNFDCTPVRWRNKSKWHMMNPYGVVRHSRRNG